MGQGTLQKILNVSAGMTAALLLTACANEQGRPAEINSAGEDNLITISEKAPAKPASVQEPLITAVDSEGRPIEEHTALMPAPLTIMNATGRELTDDEIIELKIKQLGMNIRGEQGWATLEEPPTRANQETKAAPTAKKSPPKTILSAAVDKALRDVSKETGLPYEVMLATCSRESNCIAENMNPKSNACGLFQFITDMRSQTLYEVLYKFGPQRGYANQAQWVERYARSYKLAKDKDGNTLKDKNGNDVKLAVLGYRPLNNDPAYKEKIISLCKDPKFNAEMFAAYTMPNIEKYEVWLNRKATMGEILVMNNLGLKGVQLLAGQAWNDKKSGTDTLSIDFFKQHQKIFGDVSANKTMLRHKSGTPKTVRETYNDIFEFTGWGDLEIKRAQDAIPEIG